MADTDKKNQNLMMLIKRMHGILENTDIEKHRQSQDYIGVLFGSNKELEYRDVDIDGMHGEWASVNRPHLKKNVILYCHGGGYSTGSCLYGRTLTSKLALSTSMDVLCFDYRLAPENPYPCGAEDAMKAWNYLLLSGYGAGNIIVAGDSAGGNMALALCHKLKEETRFLPCGLILMSPWTDLTMSGKSYETKAMLDPVLNREYIGRMAKAYIGTEDRKLLENPLISPVFGEFKDFPPTYIQVGSNEILLSDSLLLHQKMTHAGVSVKLDRFDGMWHVFQMSPFKTAYEAVDRAAEFVFEICR